MKIMMLCGSNPPQFCGIGDYTNKLVEYLEKKSDVQIKVLDNIKWGITNFYNICKLIDDFSPDVIHIQFPALGYKLSITPQLISLKFKCVITIHEVSQFHPIRKMWLLPFSIRGTVIFTNDFERKYFKKLFPWSKNKSYIIPIGSHLSIYGEEKKRIESKDFLTIISFGQIRPKKGIEEVIKLAELIEQNNLPYSIKIIGSILDSNRLYANTLKNQSKHLPIEWLYNLTEAEVTNIFEENVIGYLPFPDGASERRTSLLSMLNSKMLVYTTHGKQTPNNISNSVIFVADSLEMLNHIKSITEEELKKLVKERFIYIADYMAKFSWVSITEKHLSLYRDLLNKA